jgi:hypothetical protein
VKTNLTKPLTFGEFVAGVYAGCHRRKAKAIVRIAVNTKQIVFQGRRFFVS